MIDLMFTAHNRLEFTREAFVSLCENTNWSLVDRLFVLDDRSRDGTYEALAEMIRNAPTRSSLTRSDFGGPVAAFNYALDKTESEVIGKIDNDVIVCPGWLDTMLATLLKEDKIDFLGMEPGFAGDVIPAGITRTAKPAKWIGGVGLFRTRAFANCRPQQTNRFFGMTSFQRRFGRAAWIDPDLPVFLLDHLPLEPWLSLTKTYIRRGWARPWNSVYDMDQVEDYAGWWLRERLAVA